MQVSYLLAMNLQQRRPPPQAERGLFHRQDSRGRSLPRKHSGLSSSPYLQLVLAFTFLILIAQDESRKGDMRQACRHSLPAYQGLFFVKA